MSLTQKKNYAQGFGFNPQIVVSFFNELATERKTMLKASVSFFSELAIEKRNYGHSFSLIMASKRSSLDGRTILWKEHMSRSTTGVRRSSSNSPTKEITMSTTGSKS